MPRRKGLLEQIVSANAQARKDRERQEAHAMRVRAAAQRELDQAVRRADAARLAAEKAADARRRSQEADARRSARERAAEAREAERSAREERLARAHVQAAEGTELVQRHVDRLGALLTRRAGAHQRVAADIDLTAAAGRARHVMRRSTWPAVSTALTPDEGRRAVLADVVAAAPSDVVPEALSYRVNRSGQVEQVPRTLTESRRLYREHIARLALRTLREVFDLIGPAQLDEVWLSIAVDTVDPATGREVRRTLLRATVDRALLDSINIDSPHLDPCVCVERQLKSVASRNAYDIEPVPPFTSHDLSGFAIYVGADGADRLEGLDSRLDLLTMDPREFELLTRDLFVAMGYTSWDTTSSNDGGVDAVVLSPDTYTGGEVIVQAKRYTKAVGRPAVDELLGVMSRRHATRAILVTTSWLAPSARQVVDADPRMKAIEGNELCHLVQTHLGRDVVVAHDTVPRNWTLRSTS